MELTKSIQDALYNRAVGRCECQMRICSHHLPGQRCTNGLWAGSWQAHRLNAGGPYVLSNLVAMCKTCHKNTPSYGRG